MRKTCPSSRDIQCSPVEASFETVKVFSMPKGGAVATGPMTLCGVPTGFHVPTIPAGMIENPGAGGGDGGAGGLGAGVGVGVGG